MACPTTYFLPRRQTSQRQIEYSQFRIVSAQFRSNLFGITVMALVNAFQNSSFEASGYNQPAGEPAARFMKIRSIWPFPVRGSQEPDPGDSELQLEESGESVSPSSFIT